MNEKQTSASQVRPTKKQRELLSFIESFISEHGYSPSYREIMTGLNYTSVATVALHVSNLIKRGHIVKRDRSARSLEVVTHQAPHVLSSNQVAASEERWLVEKVDHAFHQAELLGQEFVGDSITPLTILISALQILGLDAAANSFGPRLKKLKEVVNQPR